MFTTEIETRHRYSEDIYLMRYQIQYKTQEVEFIKEVFFVSVTERTICFFLVVCSTDTKLK